jgi:tRNA C32,U32 (ribose-2'-O)-methylase TrmJ
MASGALDVLAAARVVPALADALSGMQVAMCHRDDAA